MMLTFKRVNLQYQNEKSNYIFIDVHISVVYGRE